MPSAGAATQSRDDPVDAPAGSVGKADLRTIAWDVSDAAAKVTVTQEASTYSGCGGTCRAQFGVHVLLDTDADGLADAQVVATRSADGLKADVSVRTLDHVLSSTDCQALDGKPTTASATLDTSVAGGLESFTFTFDPSVVPGGLAAFRWGAFAQAPPDGAIGGPWDVMPDTADPAPATANPGDRRCDSAKSGVPVRMKDAVAFPDAAQPTPTPTPGPAPPPPPKPVVVLALPGGQPQAGVPATIDASRTVAAAGARIVAYEWDTDGDHHVDTNTGTNPIAHVLTGSADQTVIVTAIDSNFNSASAEIHLDPGASPAGCDSEASIGVLRIRAACIRHVGEETVANPVPSERYWSNYVVNLNGLSLVTRDPHATVTFNERRREIVAHGQFRVMILNGPDGDVTFFESGADGFSWPLPSGAGAPGGEPTSLVSFQVAHDCQSYDEGGGALHAQCATVPGGFPVVGRADLGIDADTYEVTLDVNVRISDPVALTGHIRLRASAIRGLILDAIGFGIEGAQFGPVTLNRLAFDYEPPGGGSPQHEGGQWDVQVSIGFETPHFEVAGRMIFIDGAFNYMSADVTFTPGIPVYAGVFLNRFAGSFGINPQRLGGGMGANFANFLQLLVDWNYVNFADGRQAFRGSGTATIVGGEFAHFTMDFWSDGYFAFSGRIGYSYPSFDNAFFSMFGQTDFWVEAEPDGRRARYQGDGDLAILIRGVRITSIHGFINNDFAAGCGYGWRGSHSYHTGHDTLVPAFPSCDLGEFTIQPTRSHEGITPPGHAASLRDAAVRALPAPPARAFTVAAGRRALVLQVEGVGGAPRLTLADPKGRVYTPTTTPDKPAIDGDFASAYLPGGGTVALTVRHPIPGEWTLTPQPGSPAIKQVESTDALAPLRVSARVSGHGRQRVLTWHAPGLGGREIRFVERGKDVGQTIVVTKATRGSARYTLQGGAAGPRTVQAQVTLGGIPQATPVVARYRAPGPPRPGRPGRLTVRRSHGTVTVRWPRLKGTKGYVVRVSGSDGRRELHFPGAAKRVVRIRQVAAVTKLKVTVAGWIGTVRITGPRRSATVRAVPAKPKPRATG